MKINNLEYINYISDVKCHIGHFSQFRLRYNILFQAQLQSRYFQKLIFCNIRYSDTDHFEF